MSQYKAGLVSVIIPAYNYGAYLAEAVNSALGQSYSEVEVIVVDDGSTDDTEQVALSFGNKIIYIKQKNQGVVAARNNGAAAARGEYLCFLDADDYMDQQYVEVLVAALQTADLSVGFAYTDVTLIKAEGVQVQVKQSQYRLGKLLSVNTIPSLVMQRADAFRQVGGYQTDDSKGYSFEDWDMWLTLIEGGFTGMYVPGSRSYYRLHGAGRNIMGEQHRRELVHSMRQAHPQLYRNMGLRIEATMYAALYFVGRSVLRLMGPFRSLIHA